MSASSGPALWLLCPADQGLRCSCPCIEAALSSYAVDIALTLGEAFGDPAGSHSPYGSTGGCFTAYSLHPPAMPEVCLVKRVKAFRGINRLRPNLRPGPPYLFHGALTWRPTSVYQDPMSLGQSRNRFHQLQTRCLDRPVG